MSERAGDPQVGTQSTPSKRLALLQVVLVAAGAHGTIEVAGLLFGDVAIYEGIFPEPREKIASALTRSFFSFVFFISFLVFVVRSRVVIDALATLRSMAAPARAWKLAIFIAVSDAAIIAAFFIKEPAYILEASLFNLFMTVLAAVGPGIGEETVYRAFIVGTLSKAKFHIHAQALISGALFGLVHFNWVLASTDANLLMRLSPVLGTFALGYGLAIVYKFSGHRLWPCVAAHALINIVIEPAMALGYFG